MGESIRSGAFSIHLVRPFPYHLWQLSAEVAYKGVRVVISGADAAALLSAVWAGDARRLLRLTRAWEIVPILLWASMAQVGDCRSCMSFLLTTASSYAWGCWRFGWARRRASSISYAVVTMFLAGSIVPLDLMPEAVERVTHFLPFRYLYFFQVQLLQGRLDFLSALGGLAIQAGWLLVSYLFVQWVFLGVRRRRQLRKAFIAIQAGWCSFQVVELVEYLCQWVCLAAVSDSSLWLFVCEARLCNATGGSTLAFAKNSFLNALEYRPEFHGLEHRDHLLLPPWSMWPQSRSFSVTCRPSAAGAWSRCSCWRLRCNDCGRHRGVDLRREHERALRPYQSRRTGLRAEQAGEYALLRFHPQVRLGPAAVVCMGLLAEPVTWRRAVPQVCHGAAGGASVTARCSDQAACLIAFRCGSSIISATFFAGRLNNVGGAPLLQSASARPPACLPTSFAACCALA